MTINDRPAGGFDVYASPCLVADMPGLQHPGKTSGYWSDAEVWQRNFSTAVWADATPGGRQLDPIEPSAVDGVVIAALVRVNNGRTVATLRAGRRWVGVESDHMDTLGETFLFAGRAHVADCFADVVRFGFGNWEREDLGLPAEIDDAVRWANWIEDSHGASMTRLLDRLDGDRSLWSSALSLSPADSDSRWNGGPPSIRPRWRRLLRRAQRSNDDGAGFDVALLRLHYSLYTSFSAAKRSNLGDPFIADPVIHEDRISDDRSGVRADATDGARTRWRLNWRLALPLIARPKRHGSGTGPHVGRTHQRRTPSRLRDRARQRGSTDSTVSSECG